MRKRKKAQKWQLNNIGESSIHNTLLYIRSEKKTFIQTRDALIALDSPILVQIYMLKI